MSCVRGILSMLFVLSAGALGCHGPEAAQSPTGAAAKASTLEAVSPLPESSERAMVAGADSAGGTGGPRPASSSTGETENEGVQAPSVVVARAVAASWLTSLAAGDRRAVERQSSPSLNVIGFWLPSGSERAGCGQDTDRLNELSARVADGLSPARVVDCVARDLLLVDALPQYAASQWPEALAAPDAKGRVGYLRVLDLEVVPPRLTRYRKELSAVAAGGALLTFFATDRGGTTAYGAIVVRHSAGEPRVASVFIDEKLEE